LAPSRNNRLQTPRTRVLSIILSADLTLAEDHTLQGIADGHVHGTVSQQPYVYGYESVKVLAALARGDQSVIPEDGFIEVESTVVRKDNVAEFRAKLAELKGE